MIKLLKNLTKKDFIYAFISFILIKIDFPLMLAFVCATTNIIPIIGPYIGGIPAVLVGFSINSRTGFITLILIIILQFIESNIIQPAILKNTISLHPLEGIFGLIALNNLFGVIGMILSPLILTAIKIVIKNYRYNQKNTKNIIEN